MNEQLIESRKSKTICGDEKAHRLAQPYSNRSFIVSPLGAISSRSPCFHRHRYHCFSVELCL